MVSAFGRKVYYNSEGKMCYGEKQINGNWYYFNTWNGAMVTGWYWYRKKVYYGADGAMLHGTQVIGGQTYRFDSVTGALLLNGMEIKSANI